MKILKNKDMKSLNKFITEQKGSVVCHYNDNPEWNGLTIGVDYNDELVVIFGEPASKKQSDRYKTAYNLAKAVFPRKASSIPETIEDAVEWVEEMVGEEVDEQECLCICYIVESDELTIYTLGNGGVEPIN